MYNTEFNKRRELFCQGMKERSFALLTSGFAPFKGKDQLFPFFVNRNFFYLTGLQREKFVLVLVKGEGTNFEYLFIEEPSDFATKWIGRKMTVEEASEISGIDSANIFFLQNLDSFLANRILLDSRHALVRKPNNLYLDLFREYLMEKPSVLNRFDKLIQTYPELKILDACEILDGLRRIKSESEIKHMSQAVEYTRLGIETMMKAVKPNMNERQLESLFEYTIKQNGSFGTSFNTIVASGKNATVLHYEDNNSNISEGSLVLTDLGALSSEYAGDITRTYPANGVFTKRQREYYELVLSVNKAIIDMIKPGVTFKDLNVKAYDLLAEGMIKLGKIKEKSELTKYYYHSIGHYLGLDVHDVGSNILPFEPGVVLTVEPGIYIEEEGIGVRIEDNILVTDKGHKNLSEKIIKEVKDIEEFMKK